MQRGPDGDCGSSGVSVLSRGGDAPDRVRKYLERSELPNVKHLDELRRISQERAPYAKRGARSMPVIRIPYEAGTLGKVGEGLSPLQAHFCVSLEPFNVVADPIRLLAPERNSI